MGPFEMVAIIVTAGCILEAYKYKHKQPKNNRALESQQQKEIEELKNRVETLEKIVTDNAYQLNKEFEKL